MADPIQPKQVVVAYDFSDSADLALDRAVAIACRAPNHVLHVVAAIDPGEGFGDAGEDPIDWRYAERVQERLLERLGRIFALRAPEMTFDFYVHARIGEPAQEILDLAEEIGADFIVIGVGKPRLRRKLMGSTTEAVVRDARCPVMVARRKEYAEVRLEKVVRVQRDAPMRRARPRRYAYTTTFAALRPDDWPIH